MLVSFTNYQLTLLLIITLLPLRLCTSESIHATLVSSGSVLIPTDSSARVLELAYLLDQRFQNVNYPLILLTHMSYRTITYAKSMLEWMSDAINRQFDSTRENPFEFR
jgi:cleavage and polyadenylation specificity factor subunit 2